MQQTRCAPLWRINPQRSASQHPQDRTVITTADAERVAVTPAGLQPAIDALVAQAGEQVRWRGGAGCVWRMWVQLDAGRKGLAWQGVPLATGS